MKKENDRLRLAPSSLGILSKSEDFRSVFKETLISCSCRTDYQNSGSRFNFKDIRATKTTSMQSLDKSSMIKSGS